MIADWRGSMKWFFGVVARGGCEARLVVDFIIRLNGQRLVGVSGCVVRLTAWLGALLSG